MGCLAGGSSAYVLGSIVASALAIAGKGKSWRAVQAGGATVRQIEKDTACLLQLEAPRGASIAAQHSNGRSNRSKHRTVLVFCSCGILVQLGNAMPRIHRWLACCHGAVWYIGTSLDAAVVRCVMLAHTAGWLSIPH